MTILTMTAAIVAAVEEYHRFATVEKGNPISHVQLIDVYEFLSSRKLLSRIDVRPCSLDQLLRGSRIYRVSTVEKIAKTPEYVELMASLRREEEARQYRQMLRYDTESVPLGRRSTSSTADYASLSLSNNFQPTDDRDEMTFVDLSRQIALIVNVVVSVLACAVAIWLVSRWWDTPMRLALSISGSIVVAIAEVVVYSAYIRQITEAKRKEQMLVEKKVVLDTWTLPKRDHHITDEDIIESKSNGSELRKRKIGRAKVIPEERLICH